jgi:hypothetical protein
VTLQDVLDDGVGASKEIRLARVGALHLFLERHGLVRRVLLSETGDVPDSDREIHRGRDDEVFLRVELSTPEQERKGKERRRGK